MDTALEICEAERNAARRAAVAIGPVPQRARRPKTPGVRLVYVGRANPSLRGKAGTLQAQGRGPGPRNRLVRLDDGTLVVAPWGCWRKAKGGGA